MAVGLVDVYIAICLLWFVWSVLKAFFLYPSDSVDKRMPHPPLSAFFGNVLQIMNDPLNVFQNWQLQYGGVFKYYYFTDPVVVVTDPEAVRYVLKDAAENFVKERDPLILDVIGNGLLLTNGELWKRHRKIMQPAFGPLYVRKTIPSFVAAGHELVSALERHRGQPFDMHLYMTKVTLDVIGLAGFGYEFGAIRDSTGAMPQAVGAILHATEKRIFQIIPWWKLSFCPSTKRFQRNKQTLLCEIREMIQKRRAEGPEKLRKAKDLLGRLLVAEDPDTGEMLGTEQLTDELITFLIAGHETTAASLAFTFYLIATHPEVEAGLVKEIEMVMGKADPTWESIQNLTYMAMVIKESMRLYPSVAMQTTRYSLKDDTIGGYHIPAGTCVEMWPYLLHRSPELWKEPLRFLPERFKDNNNHTGHYLPFGFGPRSCIGMHLATAESKVILAMVLRQFHLDIAPGHTMKPTLSITLRPVDLCMLAQDRERTSSYVEHT